MSTSRRNPVKVLSIREPEASWLFLDDPAFRKSFENRSWSTEYRGRLYIHASGKPPQDVSPADLMPLGCDAAPPWERWQCGNVIGSVELAGCVPTRDNRNRFRMPDDILADIEDAQERLRSPIPLTDQVLSDIQWRDFAYFWVFGDPERFFTPITRKGERRIWETLL